MWSDPVSRYKKTQVTLGALTLAEGDIVHEMQRVLGTVGRVVFIPDIADPAAIQRYGFIGQMRELAMLENPQYVRRGNAFSLEQG